MKIKPLLLLAILILPSALYLLLTTGKHNIKSLQFFGPKSTVEKNVNGKIVVDTVYHSIRPFTLLDQDSTEFNSVARLKDKIYVVNFFFTSCPTICKETQSLLRTVQERFSNFEDVDLLSITVDPDNDTPSKLNEFSKIVGANKDQWFFLTGNRDYIYELASKDFLLNASKDSTAPGGFLHSDMMLLIDRNQHIRGMFEGSSAKDVKRLIDEVKVLIAEYNLAKKSNTNPIK